MSEVQNTVEETPVAVAATEAPVVVVPEAAAAAAPAETAPQETAAETTDAAAPTTTAEAPTEAATEQPKEEAKEITPATDGVLGHKGPGLVKYAALLMPYPTAQERNTGLTPIPQGPPFHQALLLLLRGTRRGQEPGCLPPEREAARGQPHRRLGQPDRQGSAVHDQARRG